MLRSQLPASNEEAEFNEMQDLEIGSGEQGNGLSPQQRTLSSLEGLVTIVQNDGGPNDDLDIANAQRGSVYNSGDEVLGENSQTQRPVEEAGVTPPTENRNAFRFQRITPHVLEHFGARGFLCLLYITSSVVRHNLTRVFSVLIVVSL